MSPPLFALRNLSLDVLAPGGPTPVLTDVTLTLPAGRALALVGESGSGKSTVGLSALQLLPPAMRHQGGSVLWRGTDLTRASEAALRRVRGSQVAMVFQDPTASLNPTRTVAAQLDEVTRLHHGLSAAAARHATKKILIEVGLTAAEAVARAYPHALSGGMRQRVAIAMALLGGPALLVADEPTTALDVTVQAQVLALLRAQALARHMATLLISHDLGVVAGIADEVAVLYGGQVVERGRCSDLFAAPRHPYTATLLHAARAQSSATAATTQDAGGRPQSTAASGCRYAPCCPRAQNICHSTCPTPQQLPHPVGHEVRCHFPLPPPNEAGGHNQGACAPWALTQPTAASPQPVALRAVNLGVAYPRPRAWGFANLTALPAVRGVSFTLAPGEVLALVGESGSGKSSVARAILQLVPPSQGQLWLGATALAPPVRPARWQPRRGPQAPGWRRALQAVFQDPQASLDPRQTALDAVVEPLTVHGLGGATRQQRRRAAAALLQEVGLDAAIGNRLPHAMSGGQRQRVALARALAPEPQVLVADEPTSALDAGVKGQVLALLRRLTAERNLATLFVSHDLAAVRSLCRRTAVMLGGHIVEMGPTEAVSVGPRHPYTQALLAAEPSADPALQRLRLDALATAPPPPTAAGPVQGCPYQPRCPLRIPRCAEHMPMLLPVAPAHAVACHVRAPQAAQSAGSSS